MPEEILEVTVSPSEQQLRARDVVIINKTDLLGSQRACSAEAGPPDKGCGCVAYEAMK